MQRRGKTILIVEDHDNSGAVLARLLKLDGYEAVTAANCDDALRQASEGRFDLYIIDIGLPDGDGCELLPRLQALHRAPGIALTGMAMPDDIARGIDAGFIDYLVKPVPPKRLEEVVSGVLSG